MQQQPVANSVFSQYDVESIQRESLMKVLLDLGTAFSTTFVALILSGLVVIPLNMMLCSVEDRVLLRASRALGGEDDRGDRTGPEDPEAPGKF